MRRATVQMIPTFCWTENLLPCFTNAGGSFDGNLSRLLLLLSEELIVARMNNKHNNQCEETTEIKYYHAIFV
jgi:hypothetical protein